MNLRRFNLLHLIFALAFLSGLGLRLLNLGAAPLSEPEAELALQAFRLARGEAPAVLDAQAAYLALTSLSFALFGSSDFLARFWPALAGSLLVLAPWLLAGEAGKRQSTPLSTPAAAVLAFGFALDPSLIAVSRQAGGPMLALSFTLLSISCWTTSRWVWAAVFGALALLSGPPFLAGAVILAATWLIGRLILGRWVPDMGEAEPPLPSAESRRNLFLAAGATLLLGGSLFLLYPQILAAWFGSLSAYLSGWTAPVEIPGSRLLAAVWVYQPLALLFALIGVARSLAARFGPPYAGNGRISLIAGLWFVVGLSLLLIYPSRQAGDLVWVFVPLWAAAAIELAHHLEAREEAILSLGQAVLIVLLLALVWFNLAALTHEPPGSGFGLRTGVILGLIALGAMTTILVGLGWSWDTARLGAVWGIAAAGSLYLISVTWGLTQLHPTSPRELLNPAPAVGQQPLLLDTLSQLSLWHTGFEESLNVEATFESAALRWALRGYPQVDVAGSIPSGELPPVLITPQSAEAPALTAAYRGQDFVWRVWPGWEGALPSDPVRWLVFRQAPLIEEKVILWARGDLFPGGTLEAQEIPADTP